MIPPAEVRIVGLDDDPLQRIAVRWFTHHGRVYDVRRVKISPHGMGWCHANARTYQEQSPGRYRVVVGFAETPHGDLTPHSWIEDRANGEGLEVTWPRPSALYFGVPYERYDECRGARQSTLTPLWLVCALHARGVCGCEDIANGE